MNKISIYISGVALSLAMLTSCNDALDMTPDGRITLDQVFADADMTAKYMSNCYNRIPVKSYNYFWFQNHPTALSDEAWSADSPGGNGPIRAYKDMCSASENIFETEYHGQFDANYWKHYWKQIRTINVMLSRIGSCALHHEEDRSRWEGEALTLRAYFYLEMVKWYGDLPIIKEVLPMDFDYSGLKREPAVEVLKSIVADCDAALKTNMPWRITTANEVWRVTKAVAMAIRSQASLYAASKLYCGGQNLWNWAYEINKDCFNQLKANGYELYTQMQTTNYPNAYAEYFAQNGELSSNPVDKETIWQSDVNYNPFWDIAGTPLHGAYMTGENPSQQFVDAFDMLETGKPVLNLEQPYLDEQCLEPNYNPGSGFDPANPYEGRDPRFYAIIIYDGAKVQVGDVTKIADIHKGGLCQINQATCGSTHTGYYAKKRMHYNACREMQAQDGRWKYFRLGEIYLNLAEAAIETGDAFKMAEGISLINEIRHRAGFSTAVDVKAASQAEARRLLRHERRIELAYEEHRYFDTRRWTSGDENMENEKYCVGMQITLDGDKRIFKRFLLNSDGTNPSKMSYLSKWHHLPIPQSEAAKMEAITGDRWQNEGW